MGRVLIHFRTERESNVSLLAGIDLETWTWGKVQ